MILDKTAILDAAKDSYGAIEKSQGKKWERALMMAVDDLANRLRSRSLVRTYSTTISSGDQDAVLSGENDDLRHIWFIRMGSGDYERILGYRDPEVFAQEYDASTQTEGYAQYYTVYKYSDGFPQIRLSCPLSASESATVYYWFDLTTSDITALRSGTALILATQAFFSGLKSPEGKILFDEYKEMAALQRSNENPVPRGGVRIPLPYSEVRIRQFVKNKQRR